MAALKILALIVTYNSAKWIRKNLTSIGTEAEVLVLDNGSTDSTIRIIREEFPHVRLIENSTNVGFAAANNTGFAIAQKENFDWVFLVNHDAWLAPGCLKEMKKVMKEPRYTTYGILSPVHFSGDEVSYDYGFMRFCDTQTLGALKEEKEILEVTEINGAFMMISRRCLTQMKGFDPVYFFYGEDVDLCYRARKHGFKIGVIPKAVACHDRTDRKPDYKRSRNLLISNYLVQFKQLPGGFFTAYCKTLYSALRSFVKEPGSFRLKAAVITHLVKHRGQMKHSYNNYN